MQIKMDPKKFISLIESGMAKRNQESLISPLAVTLLENMLMIKDMTKNHDVVSLILANKEYFEDYKADIKDEIIMFDDEILDRLKDGFKNTTTFVSTEKQLKMTDGVDKSNAELQEIMDKEFPLPLTKTKYGVIPDVNKYRAKKNEKDVSKWTEEDCLKGYNIYKTTSDALKLPPKAECYTIKLDNNVLSATIPYTTTDFGHDIVGEHIFGKNIEFVISGEFYRNITSNLSGDVILLYNENRVIFINNNEKDLFKTFLAATRIK